MRQPSPEDWEEALKLIQRLHQQLSYADPTQSHVNKDLIQRAATLLDKFGRGGPTFTS